ncbi:hypothetical protein ACQHIH_16090 [Xanthomonas sontii]|uniref:hypothetical protein n=1 Tax=Xanthomonas sontii TaxID=2650745 RepID=UPI003F848510
MDKKAERPDWKATNPNYKTQPTQRHADGSISRDGGVVADQVNTLREWYRIRGVKSYA